MVEYGAGRDKSVMVDEIRDEHLEEVCARSLYRFAEKHLYWQLKAPASRGVAPVHYRVDPTKRRSKTQKSDSCMLQKLSLIVGHQQNEEME